MEGLDAPFTALLSDRLKVVEAELPALSARVGGGPARGVLAYRPAAAEPIRCSLELPEVAAATANRYLASQRVMLAGGKVTLTLQAAGRGLRDFNARFFARLSALRGTAGERRLTLREATTGADLSRRAGRLTVTGNLRASDAAFGETGASAVFDYRLDDRFVSITNGMLRLAKGTLRIGHLQGPLPYWHSIPDGRRLPVEFTFGGGVWEDGTARLAGLAGNFSGSYLSQRGNGWLEGTGDAILQALVLRGTEVGSFNGRFSSDRGGLSADLAGDALGGSLTARLTLDPFKLQQGAGFTMLLRDIRASRLAGLAGGRGGVRAADGIASAEASGRYTPGEGLRCRIAANVRDLVLTGRDGRTLLERGGAGLAAELADDTLHIGEGTVSLGREVALKLRGRVGHLASPKREAEVALSLPVTPAPKLQAALAGILPAGMRDGAATGTLSAEGTLRLAGGDLRLDGEVAVADGGVEVPAQKLSIAGIGGRLPFSFAGTAAAAARQVRPGFDRENYPLLLARLRQGGAQGKVLKIGRIRLGALEVGDIACTIRAERGLTEITSLAATLYQGRVHGTGFFRPGETGYGAGLLLDDVSLRALCSSFPAIKGYISGRVDGIISLYGEGPGVKGMAGFIELWARSAPQEEMLVSKEFLQRLAGRKLKGIFFRSDRPYERGEIRAHLERGYLTFDVLDVSHTNLFGIRDLSVQVAPVQNRIAIDHLFNAIRTAAARGKGVARPAETPGAEFRWEE